MAERLVTDILSDLDAVDRAVRLIALSDADLTEAYLALKSPQIQAAAWLESIEKEFERRGLPLPE